jgi:hypothetical protein
MPQSYAGTPPMGLQQQMSHVRQPAEGGAFSASYQSNITPNPNCNDGLYRYLDVVGDGNASFLGFSDESGWVEVRGCSPLSGFFQLKNRRNPKDELSFWVRFSPDWSGTYAVGGAGGKFAGATGTGTYHGNYLTYGDGDYYYYSDQFNGTLKF